MNMTTALGVLFALGVATITLAIYRKLLAKNEDPHLHLTHGGASTIESQSALASKLASVDKCGKILTVITVVYGLAIGGYYIYEALFAVPV